MNPIKYAILGLSLLVLSFAAGRMTAPNIKSSEQSQTKEDKTSEKNQTTHEVIVQTKDPKSGQEVTTTTIDSDIKTDITDTTKTSSSSESSASSKASLNVSILAATSIAAPLSSPTYGVSVSKQVIGPITLGGWGLTNGAIGVSVGLNF